MSEKLKELISLLYQDKLTNFGKDQLVGIIEKLQEKIKLMDDYNYWVQLAVDRGLELEKQHAENTKLRFQDIPYLDGELKAYKVRIEELKLEYQRILDTFDKRIYRKK